MFSNSDITWHVNELVISILMDCLTSESMSQQTLSDFGGTWHFNELVIPLRMDFLISESMPD
jgi:hypothetical protein